MLKSLNYGPTDNKLTNSPSSFFGLPLTQFSSDDEQLPTPVEVSSDLAIRSLWFSCGV